MEAGKTVLVPLDQSAVAAAAVPYAAAVAKAMGSSLLLFSVVQTRFEGPILRRLEADEQLNQRRQAAAEAYLVSMAASLREPGLGVATRAVMGEPVEQILAAAEDESAGMVAMATHGRSGVERWFIGSVADKVMRLGHKPTLLMRPAESQEPKRVVTLRRLLVPLDGSPLAEAALAPATDLARAAGASLVLLRVQPPLTMGLAYDRYVPDLAGWEDEIFAAATSYLDGIKSRVPAGVRVEAFALRGLVEPVIEDYVQRHGIDLVLMNTHGHGGLQRLLVGSTADRLVRSGVPTLLLRPQPAESDAPPQPADATGASQRSL